jgi:hypothetical protein
MFSITSACCDTEEQRSKNRPIRFSLNSPDSTEPQTSTNLTAENSSARASRDRWFVIVTKDSSPVRRKFIKTSQYSTSTADGEQGEIPWLGDLRVKTRINGMALVVMFHRNAILQNGVQLEPR